MRRWMLCVALPFLAAAGPAAQSPVSEGPAQIGLTVYTSNLALVQETRPLDLPAGRTRLEFKGVSTGIRPETVALTGPGLSVVEQNFDYDLLTPSKMMDKAVGKQIQIIRTVPGTGAQTTETATVLSTNQGVVLKVGDHIEVLRDDGIPTRVIFDGIPETLRARPTLSVTLEAQNGGPRNVLLSYLTTGLTWTADYVAQFDDKTGNLALQGWVTLSNHTGTSFADVAPKLVAESVSSAPPRLPGPIRPVNGAVKAGGNASESGDFPIYTLPTKVTVAENQTKQVSFLDDAAIKARKLYQYRAFGFSSQETPDHATTALAFANGKPMPPGTVRVYMRDTDGTQKFVGEQHIDAAPGGSDINVTLGDAFDVTVQATVVASEKLAGNRVRRTMRYEFRNAGAAPVTVQFRQGGLAGSDSEVASQSQPGQRIDAFTQGWDVAVPAHGGTTLSFIAVGN